MNSNANDLLKKTRFDYFRRNRALLETLYYCFELSGLNYEEIAEHLEKEGENTAGLLIRLERGIELELIIHNRVSSLKERKYYIASEGKNLYELHELSISICEDTIRSAMEIKKGIEEIIRKEDEKTKYII